LAQLLAYCAALLHKSLSLRATGDDIEMKLETKHLATRHDYLAPDGSEIRLLPNGKGGGLAHCTLAPGRTSLAVRHRTVEEIWYFLEGTGEVWRKFGGKENTIKVEPGDSLTIPVGCCFQFRNKGVERLRFIIATMPKWPGLGEAVLVTNHWKSTSNKP
jgi:mannose-6-phosphate isomerase-like protein (cupin superfamily)